MSGTFTSSPCAINAHLRRPPAPSASLLFNANPFFSFRQYASRSRNWDSLRAMAAVAAAAAAAPRKQIHIDVVQSVMPVAVTPPGQSRRVSTTGGPLRPDLLQSRVRIVLYYEDDKGAASPAMVAAWIKESLSAALVTEPVMAGRLRREDDGNGQWEVKLNDCGARLVQATAEASMAEFMSGDGDGDGWEAELAHWVDVDEENPNFSALFYVQVTEFHGGGFSIGISCSLLLADPFFLGRFLNSWALTHAAMLAHGQITHSPIFHLAYFQRPGQSNHLKSIDLGSNPRTTNTTLLFATDPTTNINVCQIADDYFRVATRRLDKKDLSKYSLMISDHSGDKVVDSCVIASLNVVDEMHLVGGAREDAWVNQLGLEKMSFVGGNDPIRISGQIISCVGDDGLVMIIKPPKKAWLISVTIPMI